MATFEQVDEARRLLGLRETATLRQLKRAYRSAANRYHPDRCKDADKPRCEEMMKGVNKAYTLLAKYFADYCYSFQQEDIERTYPDEEYMRKYKHRWFDSI